MPYAATVEDIMQFLGDLSFGILPNGIHMVLNQQVILGYRRMEYAEVNW